jgi:DnaK suppressor protein
MRKKTLEFFKNELIKKKHELIQEANKTLSGLQDENSEFPDMVDRSTAEEERSFTLKLRDRERKLIKKIDEAITRIDNNTYGDCQRCGGKINEDRLKVRPVAVLCIECKEKEEKLEQMEKIG